MKVENGNMVSVHYTGTLNNGEVFDSSDGREPLQFQIGAGMIIEGFEEAVMGMEVGDEKSISIPPENAYGQRDEELIRSVPRTAMGEEVKPEIGMTLVVRLENGDEIPVTVRTVTDEEVTLDPNHPLAGETLNFKIKVVDIQEGDPNACGCGCGCGDKGNGCEEPGSCCS